MTLNSQVVEKEILSQHRLVRTKLSAPVRRPGLVLRPRLQAHIEQGIRRPLTLLVAPAGFGKTTLVAATLADCAIRAGWLSLDRGDNQPHSFLSYLVAAVQEVDSALGSEAKWLLTTAQETPGEAVLTSLVNDLDKTGRDLVLVLDDYQFIDSPEVHEDVRFLLQHCPRALHLVIASRSDPPLPLPRLRARGQMVEIRAADLRFSEPEAELFLNDSMGLSLDSTSVAALAERTEGWAAGLQMAALSMRDRQDVGRFIEKFSGTNRYILDYLLEEVLASQPPEIQGFLLHTSILERLTAPLCDVLLQAEKTPGREADGTRSFAQAGWSRGSVSILEYLERANLFLIPLDDERQWYRYHHLFADLLRAQLRKSVGEEGIACLHLLASEWHEQNGSILDAIHHASLASDFQRIERLIEQNYMEMVNHGEMSWVRFWMGQLSREMVFQRPWLCLYEAFSHSWFGELDQAQFLLNEGEKRIRSDVSTAETRAMMGYHDYVQSRVTAMRGDTPRAIEFCRSARENTPRDNLGLQVEMAVTLGYEHFLNGDFRNARGALLKAIESGSALGGVNSPVSAYCVLARLHIAQGLLHDAYDEYQTASRLVEEREGEYYGAIAIVEVGFAELLCEWNDLETALARVKKGLDLLPLWGKADDLSLAYATAIRIQLALGEEAEAQGTVEKAVQLIQSCGVFSEARRAVETAQVGLWLAQCDWPAIERWSAKLDPISGRPIGFEDELIGIALARIFIAQSKFDQATWLLERLEESARSSERNGRLIQILVLGALASQGAGDVPRAESALGKALKLAEPEGYVRVFLDEGEPMQALLGRWLAARASDPSKSYASQLLSQFHGGPHTAAPAVRKHTPTDRLIEPLTERELEVLRIIALGRTNQEIARELVVSPGTVKAHTASIYRKLDVANRTEAVARARQLGVLP